MFLRQIAPPCQSKEYLFSLLMCGAAIAGNVGLTRRTSLLVEKRIQSPSRMMQLLQGNGAGNGVTWNPFWEYCTFDFYSKCSVVHSMQSFFRNAAFCGEHKMFHSTLPTLHTMSWDLLTFFFEQRLVRTSCYGGMIDGDRIFICQDMSWAARLSSATVFCLKHVL